MYWRLLVMWGGALALIILLFYLIRSKYRGTPSAFSGDAKALVMARRAVVMLYPR